MSQVRFLTLLVLTSLAASAGQAATYLFEVEGKFSGWNEGSVLASTQPASTQPTQVGWGGAMMAEDNHYGSIVVDTDDMLYYDSSTGLFETYATTSLPRAFKNCTGMLSLLCDDLPNVKTFSSSLDYVHAGNFDINVALEIGATVDGYAGHYTVEMFGAPSVNGVSLHREYSVGWEGGTFDLTKVSISAIPLPASLLLLLAGIGGLGFVGRRKKTVS